MGTSDRRQRERAARERAILDAALARFGTESWTSVTVDDIAADVEIAKGTIYKHFVSKDAIYATLGVEIAERQLVAMRAVPHTDDVIARLRALIGTFWDLRMALPVPARRVVLYCARDDLRASLPPALRDRMQAVEAAYAALVQEVLVAGVREGILRPLPPHLLGFGPLSALQGALQMAWAGCTLGHDANEFRDALLDFILVGMVRTD